MRKGKLVLLAAAFALAAVVPVSALAADRAGLGLEWGMGPNTFLLGNFNMQMDNTFAVSWKVSDAFTVAVFNESALWHGENSYTSEAASDPSGNQQDYTLVQEGGVSISGIRILHSLPMIDVLSAGIELGTVNFTTTAASPVVRRGDGGLTTGNEFGALGTMPTTATLLGVAAKLSVFKAETKTLTTDINVSGALRFINFPETNLFGDQEVLLAKQKEIKPITGYNNLTLLLGIGLWF